MNTQWMEQCDSANVLLVEGNDDCNIIKKICEDNNIDENSFGFCNCKNDDKVLSKLNSLLRLAEAEIIGVILDADDNIKKRYAEIKYKVKDFYTLPADFPKTGLVVEKERLPKLGIWIMPNNQDNGALEEFYLNLATGIDTKFIDDTIKQAEKKNLTSFKPQHRKKATIHTYFAWQDKPGMPLYSAINNIALNNKADIAKKFKSWLTKLFS